MESKDEFILKKLNRYQTPLTKELKESLRKNVWSDLVEYIDTVKMISWLIEPEEVRGFAKDRPRDNEGKIIVDITKPHILEDMDFFRERALFYEKYGKYTDIRPNPNPKSDYATFWKEELRRWDEGLIRPSDGEWIPGWYYFYLNYSPIWLNEKVDNGSKSGKSKGIRVRKFPKPWLGDYMFFHYMNMARENGHHCKILKTRGVGFSFKTGAMSPRNMYVERGLPNFHLASDKTFLEGQKGVFGKVVDTLDWIAETTPFARLRLTDRPLEKVLGYKDGDGVAKGLKSSVYGISLKDAPDKARGIRGPLIHYEEDGLFPNLEKAWNVNRKAVEDGDIVYGTMFAGGTGGCEGASFEGSEKLFYSPNAYNIQPLKNVFDKNTNGKTECGFFWGAYLNRAMCYDESTGEPDVIKALIEVLNDRDLVKRSSNDPTALTQKKAEEPIVPQEAVMKTTGTIFPVSDLKDCKEAILIQGEAFYNEHFVGRLKRSEGGITWQPDRDLYPVRKFPHTANKPEGALEIFEMPKTTSKGVCSGRYIAGCDPIDDDSSTTVSLPSIFILDLYTDRIVAEYTGRPKFADDFYEVAMRMLEFYNATLLYENDKKGLFKYFDYKNKTYLLADTPEYLKNTEVVKSNLYGNKNKGLNSSKIINAHGRSLLKDWLMTPSQSQKTDDEGNQVGERLNMHDIRSICLLEELIMWNIDGNFDRVSAMGMLMIYRAEMLKYLESDKEDSKNDMSRPENDEYFRLNYPF